VKPARIATFATVFALGALAGTAATTWAGSVPAGSGIVQASVLGAADARPRVAPSGKARITFLAQGRNAFVGRLEMEPGAAVPEHRDPTEEVIHVLEGGGTITIDGVAHTIGPGSTVLMPPDALVTYQNGDQRLVAVQVFAGPGPAAKYDTWAPAP